MPRGRVGRFALGFALATLLTFVPGSLLPPLGALLTLGTVAVIAVWYVREGRVRTEGTSFLAGLLVGVPVMLLLFLAAGLAGAVIGLVVAALPFLEFLRYVI